MIIQVNTDDNISGSAELTTRVQVVVDEALRRFGDRVTRVEVHLSDENSHKSGPDDKRCMMEARLAGRPPTAVTDQAATLDQAIRGAADKLLRQIESDLGRLRDR
jgi:hypothetical protein